MPGSPSLAVDVWSDVVCPWCFIGRAHLGLALREFEHADDVVVTLHSFELDPHAPPRYAESEPERLARRLGRSPEEIRRMMAGVAERGAAVGLDLRLETARSGSSFDAHRLLHLARASGRQDALADRLFRGYFTDGEPIGDHEALTRLAVEAGLAPDDVAGVLATQRFADDVRADEATAADLGITGVPFFVLDRRLGVSGAQPAEVLLSALRRAWNERETAYLTV